MSFYLFKILPQQLQEDYKFYFNTLIIVMKRPKETTFPYTRTFLYESFKSLGRVLAKFLTKNEATLNSDQKALIRDLINLIQNLNRYLRFSDTSNYPTVIDELTLEKLNEYTKNETAKRRTLRGPFEVTFLKTSQFLELAKKLENEAYTFLN